LAAEKLGQVQKKVRLLQFSRDLKWVEKPMEALAAQAARTIIIYCPFS